MEIEKASISKDNKICFKILGNIKYKYDNKNYELEKLLSNVKINYNCILNKYFLLIPIKSKTIKTENKKNIISLDPGLREFMTGVSGNEYLKIGSKVNEIISSKLIKLDKITNNPNIPKSIKTKYTKRTNRKILNKVNDLHWKTIKFLTTNYKNILLGDMSAQSITSKNNSVLSKISKVACLRTKYYKFSQRLQYKCNATRTNFSMVDERYTSKLCSCCGNYKEELKGEKIYMCSKCDYKNDRDINACRNIYIKYLMVD